MVRDVFLPGVFFAARVEARFIRFFLQKTDPGFVFPHAAAEGWAEKNNQTGIETKLGNRNPDWTGVVFKVGSAI